LGFFVYNSPLAPNGGTFLINIVKTNIKKCYSKNLNSKKIDIKFPHWGQGGYIHFVILLIAGIPTFVGMTWALIVFKISRTKTKKQNSRHSQISAEKRRKYWESLPSLG
jgi:hypothetical protein